MSNISNVSLFHIAKRGQSFRNQYVVVIPDTFNLLQSHPIDEPYLIYFATHYEISAER